MDIATVFSNIRDGEIIWAVLILVAFDVLLGIMRSLKNHHFKSSINKQGIISKCGVMVSVIFFYVLDLLLGIQGIGFAELFGSTICMSELVSIATNLQALNVPLPKLITELIEKFTEEDKSSVTKEEI